MSYILDALKKTEREKARKERQQGGMIGIAGELFRDETPAEPSGVSLPKIAMVVVVVVLVTAGATWYLLRGSKPVRATTPMVPAATPVPAPVVVSSPAAVIPPPPAAAPSAAPVAPLAVPVEQPSAAAPPRTARAATPPQPVQVAPEQDAGEPEPVRRRTRQPRAQEAVSPSSPAAQGAAAPLAAPPVDIKVSGIAWQDERNARRAVINGFLLKEGSSVAGARVMEIQQDRVRFSLAGRNFDVPLLAAGMPAQKQQ